MAEVTGAKSPARWLAPLVVVAVTVLAFAMTLTAGFVNWDDEVYVTQHPFVVHPTFAGLGHVWTSGYANLYVPLVYTSYAFDVLVGGGKPWAFHLGNVLLHAVSALVAYLVLLELWRSRAALPSGNVPVSAPTIAALAALVFAVHPLQAEPVAWVTGRKDVLSGLLALMAMWLYLKGGERIGERRWWHVGACACFGLSLLAKPGVVALPVGLLALDVVGLRRGLKQSALRLLPWFAVAGVCVLMTSRVQAIPAWLAATMPVSKRPLIASDALLFYAGKVLLPVGLAADYGRSPVTVGTAEWEWIKVPVVACAVALCLWRRGMGSAGILFFGALLLPVLGFAPFLFQDISTVADRYAYLPMLGVAVTVQAGLFALKESRPALWRPALGTTCGLVVVLAVMTAVQVRVWSDSITLWKSSIANAPRAAHAHYFLGQLLSEAKDGEGAIAELRRATELLPGLVEAWDALGDELVKWKHYEEAIRVCSTSVKMHGSAGTTDRRMCLARHNLAIAYLWTKRLDDAAAQLQAVLALRPDPDIAAGARTNLGLILAQQGKTQEAATQFEAALKIDPGSQQARRALEMLKGAPRQ